jgi:outer membrane lipoprotein-sorting protein
MSCVRAHRSAPLLLLSALLSLTIASCRTASETTSSEPTKSDTVVSTTPPFQTKEPERYSATRTITTSGPNGEKYVFSTLIGRDGLMRREESASEQTRIVYLDSPEGRLILWPEQKVYAALFGNYGGPPPGPDQEEASPDSLLHGDHVDTTFQRLGVETVAGRSTDKFRVVVNSPVREYVKPSETLMWIDSELKMPIKSEMRSPDGVVIVTELSDITLQPDKQLFQIPASYEKIGYEVLQKQLKARGLNP